LRNPALRKQLLIDYFYSGDEAQDKVGLPAGCSDQLCARQAR